MTKRLASTVAWLLVASIPLSLAAGLWIISLPHEGVLDAERSNNPFVITAVIGFGVVGALIVSHHPRHAVGWIYCLGAALFALSYPTTAYGQYAERVPGVLPAGGLMEVISGLAFIAGFGSIMTFALLLFPTGKLPSARWRPVAWLAGGTLVALFAVGALISLDPTWKWLEPVPSVLLIPVVLGSVASLFARWRAARDLERQQLKWMAVAAALLAVVILVVIVGTIAGTWPPEAEVPFAAVSLALTFFPVAAGVAILRYRLYDIDVLINRTFVYASLVAILAGLYAASIQLFKAIFVAVTGDESDAAIVITTLILATTFTPIKNRLEEIAKRRFKEPDELPPSAGAEGPTGAVRPAVASDKVETELRELRERVARLEGQASGADSGR
jgi:hypothetical protein